MSPQPDKFQRLREQARSAAHGTNARYSVGCRCGRCRCGKAQYNRSILYPSNGHGRSVSADEARRHILHLSRLGIGYLTLAASAGVNHNIVWGIRQGTRPRARYGTVQRILGVDQSCARAGTRIPAGPTWAILNGLIAEGFSRAQLARWLGYQGKNPALQIQWEYCTAETAERARQVEALFKAGKLVRGGPGLPPTTSRGVKPGGTRPEMVGKWRSDAPRCVCGKMTLKCAKARGHQCYPQELVEAVKLNKPWADRPGATSSSPANSVNSAPRKNPSGSVRSRCGRQPDAGRIAGGAAGVSRACGGTN